MRSLENCSDLLPIFKLDCLLSCCVPPSGIRIQIFRLKAPSMNAKDILVKCQNHKESESSKSFPRDKTSGLKKKDRDQSGFRLLSSNSK